MSAYKDMYLKLFNSVTDTIAMLQTVQQACEEALISGEENEHEASLREEV